MTPAQGTQLAQNVKGVEAPLHSVDVSFLRYSVWLDTGAPSTSEMLVQGQLSGTGQGSANTNMDRERAVLVRWRAGSDIRGRPVYLRKFWHSCGTFGGVGFTAANLQQTAALDSTQRAAIEQAALAVQTVSDGADSKVLTGPPPARIRTGGAESHKYLEHHQLGDMWR